MTTRRGSKVVSESPHSIVFVVALVSLSSLHRDTFALSACVIKIKFCLEETPENPGFFRGDPGVFRASCGRVERTQAIWRLD